MASLPLSTKLITFFESHNDEGVHDDIIRLLARRDLTKGYFRLYLALHAAPLGALPSLEVKVLRLKSCGTSLFGDRLLDCCSDSVLPLVKVKLCHAGGVVDSQIVREISLHGFSFLGQQYHFFAFKDLGSVFSYFAPLVQSKHSTCVSLWQSVGNFMQLQHVPVLGMRLGLLVSGACMGFTRGEGEEVVIRVIDDIHLLDDVEEIVTGEW